MAEYFFIDRSQAVQGPFDPASMRAWFEAGYLAEDLLICVGSGGEGEFNPLSELFPDAALAFMEGEAAAAGACPTTAGAWYFRDKNNAEQGPYTTDHMHQW